MSGTFTLPNGARFRTTTQRRYALVGEWPAGSGRWSAGGYTDNIATARKRAVAERYDFIVDTHTGEVVR